MANGGLGEAARRTYEAVLEFQSIIRLPATTAKRNFIDGQEEVWIHLR